MGPLEGDENHSDDYKRKKKLNVDSSDFETQQIDSQFSPDGDGDIEGNGADEFLYLTGAVPVDDTYLLDNAFETQVMNLAGETQVVDIADETQVVDLAGETQVVDLAGETQVLDDTDCMKTWPNEFNNEVGADSECEETVTADVMCETQTLSQDDSVKNDDSDSIGLKSTGDKDRSGEVPRRVAVAFVSWALKCIVSGPVCRGFTSIRAASIRASGLAARARRADRNLCSTGSDKYSLEKETFEQNVSSVVGHSSKSGRMNDRECLENDDNSEELRKSNKCKVGSTAVRQLFREDEDDEVGDSETDSDKADVNLDVPEQTDCDNCVAGLSYANSQEPGELSQAHALEVVDKFLDLNFMECDERFGRRVHRVEKPKVVPAAKGSRDLAKRSILGKTVGGGAIYDWDETREDDGGGEFFVKKKEIFFQEGGPKKRCLSEPKKSTGPGIVKAAGKRVGSGLMLRKLRSKGKSLDCGEAVLQKNVTKNLDEQLDMVSDLKLADDTVNNVPDMSNVGPDTQMAAEAMETLCFEMHLADNNDGPKDSKSRNKAAHSEQNLASRTPCPNSVGVVTRQAKRTKRVSIGASNESSVPPKHCEKTAKKRGRALEEAEERRLADVNVSVDHGTESTCQRSDMKHGVEDQLDFYVPVAHRTRKSIAVNRSRVAADSFGGGDVMNDVISARVCSKKTASRDRSAEAVTVEKVRKVGSTGFKQSNKPSIDTSGAPNIDSVDNLRETRSRQSTSADRRSSERLKRSADPALQCLDVQSKKTNSQRTVNTRSSRNGGAQCDSDHLNAKTILNNVVGASTSKQRCENNDDGISPRGGTSSSNCATPANCTTPKHNASPICMGDEYHKQSCRKSFARLSLLKEVDDLVSGSPGQYGGLRESRKRKDITAVKVLFSQHLHEDIVKQQKKILARLGGAAVSSMSDATHFVADEFVRTRNMLEAIASATPVVTHLWIESCGQASCLIDEKNYILRDARKEKEFGFSLPVSLARACQRPLLQGQKVLITPNTKPGKEILANLVKAVHGLAIERLGRSVLNDMKFPDDLLILSCEEDYDACVPLLEKGGAVYSSELLLNGIVKQKLEYERHRLFADHVRQTRSSIWVKKKNQFVPVTR